MHTHLITSSCPQDHLPNGNYDLCRFRAAARRAAAVRCAAAAACRAAAATPQVLLLRPDQRQ